MLYFESVLYDANSFSFYSKLTSILLNVKTVE
jgi:hypothetical protein